MNNQKIDNSKNFEHIKLSTWIDMSDFVFNWVRTLSLEKIPHDFFLYRGCLAHHQLIPSIERSDEKLIQYGGCGRGVKHLVDDGELDVFSRNILFVEALCLF